MDGLFTRSHGDLYQIYPIPSDIDSDERSLGSWNSRENRWAHWRNRGINDADWKVEKPGNLLKLEIRLKRDFTSSNDDEERVVLRTDPAEMARADLGNIGGDQGISGTIGIRKTIPNIRMLGSDIQAGEVDRAEERRRVLDYSTIGQVTDLKREIDQHEGRLGNIDSVEDRQSDSRNHGIKVAVEKLPESEIGLKSRTVEERIELRHTEGRLRFKKWRKFVGQERKTSPLIHWSREDDSDSDSDSDSYSDSESGPPSDDEEDEQPIRNGVIRTVSFHDDPTKRQREITQQQWKKMWDEIQIQAHVVMEDLRTAMDRKHYPKEHPRCRGAVLTVMKMQLELEKILRNSSAESGWKKDPSPGIEKLIQAIVEVDEPELQSTPEELEILRGKMETMISLP
jgi:hypothetical protein